MKMRYIEMNRTRVLVLLAVLVLVVSIVFRPRLKESESEYDLNENDVLLINPEDGSAIYITWNATGITSDDVEFRIYRFEVTSDSSDSGG